MSSPGFKVIDASVWTVPEVAVTANPVPAVVPAVYVLELPLAGSTVPPVAVQSIVSPEITLLYWSWPTAVNNCVPPTVRNWELGER